MEDRPVARIPVEEFSGSSVTSDRELRLIAEVGDQAVQLKRLIDQSGSMDNELLRNKTLHLEIICVLDDISRMIHAAIDQTDPSPFNEGISLISRNFINSLGRYGISRITLKPGDRFDPSFHEAVMSVNGPRGIIMAVSRHGYVYTDGIYKGQLLRPAAVCVGNGDEALKLTGM